MPNTAAYAAAVARAPLAPFSIERRAPRVNDVVIDIAYCGVCHSDIHQARDEWGGALFPMVPGHEIVGRVAEVGSGVTAFKAGDAVGVGCFVDSCRRCEACEAGQEQYCHRGMVQTYNSKEKDGTPTFGGYSTRIVVDANYVLRIPDGMPLDRAAPLLCAGITTYSPLRTFGASRGSRVAVVGLGGLGHLAVKIAAAMGCEVTVLSTSERKRNDAAALGAHGFVVTTDPAATKPYAGAFDLILNTASAATDYGAYLSLLRRDGTMVLLGVPDQAVQLHPFPLILGRRRLAGSLIGGIRETQEMLDFCAANNVASDIELIPIQQINEAYERTIKGDVRYRFVIDIATLRG